MLVSSNMNKNFIWAFLISFFLLLHSIRSDEEELRTTLSNLIGELAKGGSSNQASPWNLTSYPCRDQWEGVTCENENSVKNITLDGLNLSGTFNASFLCDSQSIAETLTVISLNDNNLQGENLEEIANCRQLTRLYLRGNRFTGSIPDSFLRLNNLKVLDISSNNFSGTLPDLSRISGLIEFSAQNNQLSGILPNFEFSNFDTFNVSNNNFSGPIPNGGDRLPASSFMNNAQLCGHPLPNVCPSVASDSSDKPKGGYTKDEILMITGFILVGLTVLLLAIVFFFRRRKKEEAQVEAVAKVASVDDSMAKQSYTPANFKAAPVSKSDFSTASGDQSAMVSSSLIALTSPEVNGIRFENLLKAPAELLGRGKHGSVYKVFSEEMGMTLAVKRIRDWTISSYDFKQRMRRLDRVKHPNVLPALAFYSSKQEKLLVYEYQPNGSLFNLLLGLQKGGTFDWTSRLDLAASVADGLAFMHHELREDGISHGNLKPSNILFSKNKEPYVSEYGLMLETQDPSLVEGIDSYPGSDNINKVKFKADVYAFGVILLELLTGKLVQSDGLDLASWVVSVVKEEWTVEVFDKSLIQEGASEERMVNLLQIAIKCVNRFQEARPSMNEIAAMLSTLKEEEDKSMDDVSGFTSTSIFERSP